MEILRREKRELRHASIAPGLGLVLTKYRSTIKIVNIVRSQNDHPIGSRRVAPGPSKYYNLIFKTSTNIIFKTSTNVTFKTSANVIFKTSTNVIFKTSADNISNIQPWSDHIAA
jgi:hypothetical protein